MTGPIDLLPTWRFSVYPTNGGTAYRVIYPYTAVGLPLVHGVHAFLSGTNGRGIRAQVTPDGDCRECVFSAVGAGMQVTPLTPLQLEYRQGDDWIPCFFGEVRQGGNIRNPGYEDFVLRGMTQRLKETVLPPNFKTPKQPAHLTVRAVIQAVINSGQLGTPALVLYDEALCPDLKFDCNEIKDAQQQTAYALLERIVQDGAGLNVNVAFGIRPDRKFFCQPERNDFSILPGERIIWKAPVAETPYTAVLWYVAERPDGTWVTYLSRSPMADVYGLRVKRVGVDLNVRAWVPVRLLSGRKGVGGLTTPLTVQELGHLTDGLTIKETERNIPVFTPGNPGQNNELYISVQAEHRASRWVVWGSANFGRDVMIFGDGTGQATFNLETDGLNEFRHTLYIDAEQLGAVAGGAYVDAPGFSESQFQMFEARPERVNGALLDEIAQFHYNFPAQEPAEIEIDEFRSFEDLTGRVRVDEYERPVELWEYRLTGDRGMKLAALAEQAEDPAKLAQAALIKARDDQSVITALTARK